MHLRTQLTSRASRKHPSDARFYAYQAMMDRICSTDVIPCSDEEFTSVSLAEMVQGFMEDDFEIEKCGRARCNCAAGRNYSRMINENSHSMDVLSDGDRFVLQGSQLNDLEALILTTRDAEQDMLNAVHTIMRKMEENPYSTSNSSAKKRHNNSLKWSLVHGMRRLGFNTAICHSKWDPTVEYPGGKYEYVDVLTGNDQMQERVIIDVEFLDHFKIARPTPKYEALLKTLPAVFVGGPDQLRRIVQIMCDAAELSLKQRDMHIPPWRKYAYLQTKWFSPHTRIFLETDPGIDHTRQTQEESDSRAIGARNSNSQCELIIRKTQEPWAEADQTEPARHDLRTFESERCANYRPEHTLINHDINATQEESRDHGNMILEGGAGGLAMISTEWQPPSVQPRTNQRSRIVAGLAAVLRPAELTRQTTEKTQTSSNTASPKQSNGDSRLAKLWGRTKPWNIHSKKAWIYPILDPTEESRI